MIPNAHKSQNTECPVGYSVYFFFLLNIDLFVKNSLSSKV